MALPSPSTVVEATQQPFVIDDGVIAQLRQAEKAIHECLTSCDTTDSETPAPEVPPEVSVVMPCLNEADTLEVCIRKAQQSMKEAGIRGEVVIADNGSTDGSIEIANICGARVVHVREKGYGSALMGGIEAARGKFVIMGDADDSYDFLEVPTFVERLRDGHDLVQGCRLPGGGGTIKPGAMPLLHRWLGNPMFSMMVRHMFSAPIHDVYCGLRGFTRKLYDQLDLRCSGMEFATEMIIKSSLFGVDIAETPITLHPDGRKAHAPHLRTFRDGWRTLRFFLMYSPTWLFFVPGLLLMFAGVAVGGLAFPGTTIMGATLGAHSLLYASLSILVGYQCLQFGMFTRTFAISERLMPDSPRMKWFFRTATLERGLIIGGAALTGGVFLLGAAVAKWSAVDFGPLDYGSTMRWVIPGVTLVALGCQTTLSSFFLSILLMARR
ncbi:glycosyltransferase family 2 protein [Fuerstiella marisgermanici]|uniref:Undecaprenyl-phosphate 4-deoxy-4-formamido-L-arabinose transferase n=1 Tax=Fuerstiella marisgermanici TaxID=1891926 RepID=A0A1P8W986_9PLAN|nr:glycosyltransferase family 2 protein [Fuerstiella marisgermanici]APZ90627.1 Undecaprenyl-phosphate 4-deoxy-4-formamido-L-arabinose transferase [Fuerstiella marisgermanici]